MHHTRPSNLGILLLSEMSATRKLKIGYIHQIRYKEMKVDSSVTPISAFVREELSNSLPKTVP